MKTSTFFVLLQAIRSEFSKRRTGAFHRSIPRENVFRAGMLVITSMALVCIGTFLMCVLAPQFDFVQIMFEVCVCFQYGRTFHRDHTGTWICGESGIDPDHVYWPSGV